MAFPRLLQQGGDCNDATPLASECQYFSPTFETAAPASLLRHCALAAHALACIAAPARSSET